MKRTYLKYNSRDHQGRTIIEFFFLKKVYKYYGYMNNIVLEQSHRIDINISVSCSHRGKFVTLRMRTTN